MKFFTSFFSFFIFLVAKSTSQPSMEIRYKREYLHYTDSISFRNHESRKLPLDMHMIYNDSFAFVYFYHKTIKRILKGNPIGGKIVHHGYFRNNITGEKFEEASPFGKADYLIIDSIKTWNWKFFEEEKKILGKSCRAALSVSNKNDSLLVWYTVDLPFKNAPMRYDSIPGVVMEVFDQRYNIHYEVVSIKLVDKRIVPPQNAPKITMEEYRKKVDMLRPKSFAN